jgi:hypothetical protein
VFKQTNANDVLCEIETSENDLYYVERFICQWTCQLLFKTGTLL